MSRSLSLYGPAREQASPGPYVVVGKFNAESGHTVLAMITSASNPPWPMDVPIDAAEVGLSAASKFRMKLFTLDNRLVLRKVGALSETDQRALAAAVQKLLVA